MNVNGNLPPSESTDSAEEVRNFFDKFFAHEITFPAAQIDAVVGFFLKRGFQDQAAKSTAIIILTQCRSALGYKTQVVDETFESRNIAQ